MSLSKDEQELLNVIRQHPEIVSHVLKLILDAVSKLAQHHHQADEKPPKD